MFLSRYFSKKKKNLLKCMKYGFYFLKGEYVNIVMVLMAGSVL